MLTIVKTSEGPMCNECFNKQSEQFRKGRGARPAGWVSDALPKVECSVCKREAYDTNEDDCQSY